MRLRWHLICIALLSLFAISPWASASPSPWSGGPEVLQASRVFNISDFQERDGLLTASVSIPEGYYVYRHSLSLTLSNGEKAQLVLPAAKKKHDDFFGDTQIYTGQMLTISLPAATEGLAQLHWQGCAEAGICYPPQTLPVSLHGFTPKADPASAATAMAGSSSVRKVDTPRSPRAPQPNPGKPQQPEAVGPVVSVPAASTVEHRTVSRPEPSTPPATPSGTHAGAPVPETDAPLQAEDQKAAQLLSESSSATAIIAFFGFGLLLAFTPCSLPMIPIVSTMVIGNKASTGRTLGLASAYVLAMAATYSMAGVFAGVAGSNLQAALQSPAVLGAFSLLFVTLAASLFGMFELQMPAALSNRLNRLGRKRGEGSLAAAIVMGVVSALLVGPCMTAPLAGALLYIGNSGSALYGGIALFALGLGMGAPLIAFAVFGSKVLPPPGMWMQRVRTIFAYVMLAMALVMLGRVITGELNLLLWGTWAVAAAVGLHRWSKGLSDSKFSAPALQTAAITCAVWGALMVTGAAQGNTDLLRPLKSTSATVSGGAPSLLSYQPAKTVDQVNAIIKASTEAGKWTMIDFYADWCVSCHVMERDVFSSPDVARRLSSVSLVKPDVTRNDEADRELLKHWQVPGPPTIIMIGPDGKERRDLRVVGELDVAAFEAMLDAAGIH